MIGNAMRMGAALWAAAALAACASAPPRALLATAPSEDCAVMMLVGGFIAEHQPPLRLRPITRDVAAAFSWRASAPAPETWSPDARPEAIVALGQARAAAAPERIACPVEKSPFVGWRPGRAELVLSTPAYAPERDFAVVDAAVVLPGQRVDLYRFMMNRTRSGGWDLHRMEFDSQALR